jgi:serine/threonine protein kinase
VFFYQADVPLPMTKRILRDALHGTAALHNKSIVHAEIKPHGILTDWQGAGDDVVIEWVHIADLENVAHVPDNCEIEGVKLGNRLWRSPEVHVAGPMHKSTDTFSFDLVVSLNLFHQNKSTTHT